MELGFRPILFAPREVAEIVGLTPGMQRDWRRNGYLPARTTGWSNYSLFDVSRMALRKAAADFPLRQSVADQILSHPKAERVLYSISWFALEANEPLWAFGGDGDVALKVKLETAHRMNVEHDGFIDWLSGLRHEQHASLLILTPGNDDLLLVFEGHRAGEESSGPISLTIHLDYLGREIAARANRPLVEIVPVGSRADIKGGR